MHLHLATQSMRHSQALQQKLDTAAKTQSALEGHKANLEDELQNMQKIMAGTSGSIQQLHEEKGELQAALGKQSMALSQALAEIDGLRSTAASHGATTKALEAQIDAAEERGMILERQLSMKTADWEVARAQLDTAQSEATKLRAAEQDMAQELARCAVRTVCRWHDWAQLRYVSMPSGAALLGLSCDFDIFMWRAEHVEQPGGAVLNN